MRGEYATIPDVVLESLVLPANLLSNEYLSPEEEPEEEQSYRVDTLCYHCKSKLRVCVVASVEAIHNLQQLLLTSLQFLCPSCARANYRHGRSH